MLRTLLTLFVFAATALCQTQLVVDAPSVNALAFAGKATFYGWAVDGQQKIANVSVSIDGASAVAAVYGAVRADVCAALPGRPGCPNVGWTYTLDTTTLANGSHSVAISATSAIGARVSATQQIIVVNAAPAWIPVVEATPAMGAVDGANKTFTLSMSPAFEPAIFLNGMLMRNGGDYTIAGTVVTFITAPPAGSLIQGHYLAPIH